MRSAEDFNRYYQTVDPWGLTGARFRDRTLRRAACKHVAGRSVLELGCGEGHLTETLFGEAKSVLGVDISEIAVGRAKARQLSNATFLVGDFLNLPFSGFDVIAAIECLYYLSPAEREAAFRKVATEHRNKPFVFSAPIVGDRYFTHASIVELLSRHSMMLVEAHNLTVYWDTSTKHAVAIGLKLLPFGSVLVDYVPENFIYQRCYVAIRKS